jgi:hypothetical protein
MWDAGVMRARRPPTLQRRANAALAPLWRSLGRRGLLSARRLLLRRLHRLLRESRGDMRQPWARTATGRGCGARRAQPLQTWGARLRPVGLHDALPDACAFHCGGALERAGGASGAQASAKREALGTACGHARLSVAPAANATPATHARDTSARRASPRSEQRSTWAVRAHASRRAALERERGDALSMAVLMVQ